MKVFFVGSGPGAPEHLTLKAARLIENCRCCVYAGSLVSPQVEGMIPDDAERHDSAELALEEILDVYRDARERGMDVVRLHSGDPTVYGAIGEQIRERGAAGCIAMHDIELAARFADEVALLRDGTIYDSGPPETVLTGESIEAVYGVEADVDRSGGRLHVDAIRSRPTD